MKLIFVVIGGAFGSAARYGLGKLISKSAKPGFPLGTFLINISGAILLGLLVSAGTAGNIYLLLADGFLGAYTTFSAFMYEGFSLFRDNKKLNAFLYIISSLILGVIGYFIGFNTGSLLTF